MGGDVTLRLRLFPPGVVAAVRVAGEDLAADRTGVESRFQRSRTVEQERLPQVEVPFDVGDRGLVDLGAVAAVAATAVKASRTASCSGRVVTRTRSPFGVHRPASRPDLARLPVRRPHGHHPLGTRRRPFRDGVAARPRHVALVARRQGVRPVDRGTRTGPGSRPPLQRHARRRAARRPPFRRDAHLLRRRTCLSPRPAAGGTPGARNRHSTSSARPPAKPACPSRPPATWSRHAPCARAGRTAAVSPSPTSSSARSTSAAATPRRPWTSSPQRANPTSENLARHFSQCLADRATGPSTVPRYLLRGPARGPLASGPGMTVAPCRTDDLGGGPTLLMGRMGCRTVRRIQWLRVWLGGGCLRWFF